MTTAPGPQQRHAGLDLLLSLYRTTMDPNQASRPPWTWSVLLGPERAALTKLVDEFVTHYNQVHAVNDDELVPHCWPQHPGLAYELATHLWLWYSVHLDVTASPAAAGEYYLRHLPGFQHRLDRYLGQSPWECRQGQHPRTWRRQPPHTNSGARPTHTNRQEAGFLSLLTFGFATAAVP